MTDDYAAERCRAIVRDAFERPVVLVNQQTGAVVARYPSLAEAFVELTRDAPAPVGTALGFA